jgi:probable F420-dependent oxidoreductase
VLDSDAARARAIAREGLATYLPLANYQNSWRRLGFGDDDFADGGSNRLVDRLVAWGDEAAIATRVRAFFDAGADHVCIQALTSAERTDFPRAKWRALAPALVGLGPS